MDTVKWEHRWQGILEKGEGFVFNDFFGMGSGGSDVL
jgi:hypothetical protein